MIVKKCLVSYINEHCINYSNWIQQNICDWKLIKLNQIFIIFYLYLSIKFVSIVYLTITDKGAGNGLVCTGEQGIMRKLDMSMARRRLKFTIRYIRPPHHGHTSQYHGHERMTHILFVPCQSAAPFLRSDLEIIRSSHGCGQGAMS